MLQNRTDSDDDEEEEEDDDEGNVNHVIGMLGNVIDALEKEDGNNIVVEEEEERKVVALEEEEEEETCSTFKVKTSGLDGKPFPSWYRCLRGSS